MEKSEQLYDILKKFDDNNVLDKVILVGSWCMDFYRRDLMEANLVPSVVTKDVDFLIPKPEKQHAKIDVPAILEEMQFTTRHDLTTGLMKYDKGDFTVEFITTTGRNGVYPFKNLGINAQELAYMNIPISNSYESKFKDLTVKIPEPEAFVLHKLIVAGLRKDEAKREKDLAAVKGIVQQFEISDPKRLDKLNELYQSFPPKWKSKINTHLEEYNIEIPKLVAATQNAPQKRKRLESIGYDKRNEVETFVFDKGTPNETFLEKDEYGTAAYIINEKGKKDYLGHEDTFQEMIKVVAERANKIEISDVHELKSDINLSL